MARGIVLLDELGILNFSSFHAEYFENYELKMIFHIGLTEIDKFTSYKVRSICDEEIKLNYLYEDGHQPIKFWARIKVYVQQNNITELDIINSTNAELYKSVLEEKLEGLNLTIRILK